MSTLPAQHDRNNVDCAFQVISVEYLQDMFGTKIIKIIWMPVQLVIRRLQVLPQPGQEHSYAEI